MYLVDRALQLDALALGAGVVVLGIRWYRARNPIHLVAAVAFLSLFAGVLVSEWGVVVGLRLNTASPGLDAESRNDAVGPFLLSGSILRFMGTAGLIGALTSPRWNGALRTAIMVCVGCVIVVVGVLVLVYLGIRFQG